MNNTCLWLADWGYGHHHCPGAGMPSAGLPGGDGVDLGLHLVGCPAPSPIIFSFPPSPHRLGFCGPSQEHSAYQTIDSPEVPSDPFAGPESKGHTPQAY